MRHIVPFALFTTLLVAAACAPRDPASAVPEPPAAPPPAPAAALPPSDDAGKGGKLRRLAGVLRAEDRRVEDEALLAALDDSDEEVRARAVAAIARIAAPEAVARLQPACADPAPSVRAQAAFALGILADVGAVPRLVALAADPDPSVRARAAEAIGRLASNDSAAALARLLEDGDATVRAEASLAAWKFAEPGPFVDALLARSRDGEAVVRFGAAYALGRLGSARSASPSSGPRAGRLDDAAFGRVRAALVELVAAPEAEIRMQAARGLASPASPAEATAVGSLVSDRDPGVRVNAVRAFGYAGHLIDPFVTRAVKDPHPHVTRAAVETLGRIGTPEAATILRDGVTKSKNLSSWILEPAASGYAQANPPELRGVVEDLAASADPIVRAAVPPLLVGRTEPWIPEVAARLIRDAVARVQVAAIPVAAQAPGPLSAIVGDLASAADPVVRAAVAEAAGARLARSELADDERADSLAIVRAIAAKAVADSLPDARLAAIDAAAQAKGDPEAKAILDRGLVSPDWLTRRRAAERLRSASPGGAAIDIGAATDRPLEDYLAILEWAERPRAAIVTVQRAGFAPGRFTVRLDARGAPLASWNFARLASARFFDGLVVHRVVPNFVVQDGDPRGDGWGGPGYAIRDEFNAEHFWAGTLGMASDGKDTAGSQWFVTLSAQPHLDGRYTAFGRVVRNLSGVAGQILPGDRVVGVTIYEGDGSEPLPPP